MITKKLGKISNVKFGLGGYQDAQMSLDLTFSMDGTGVGTSFGFWADHDEHCQWTLEAQTTCFAELVEHVRDLLRAAKVRDVTQLLDCPVEVTLDGNTFKSFRILEEVL